MMNCKKVRSRLTDEQSRIIYDNRLNFSMTGNVRLIWQMLEQLGGMYICLGMGHEWLYQRLLRDTHKKLCIFGAGFNGTFLRECLSEFNWFAFLDNNIETIVHEPILEARNPFFTYIGKKSLPIYNPKYYVEENGVENALFVVSVQTLGAQIAIINQLMSLGVKESNIFAFKPPHFFGPPYFDVFSASRKETFIDCGAFDGDTIWDFAGWSLGNYRKIFAFEADKNNYEKCKINVSKLQDVSLYNLGVWDCEQTLSFHENGNFSSNIPENQQKSATDNTIKIKTCALDEILKGEEISFIKMDIEGAELKALQGAAKIISEQKPKLAICVYHKPEDMWEIPDLLLELNPNYFFKLRHYRPSPYDTVLYALPQLL